MTFLLIFGMLIGDDVLDIAPDFLTAILERISNMALLMIGFLLGEKT